MHDDNKGSTNVVMIKIEDLSRANSQAMHIMQCIYALVLAPLIDILNTEHLSDGRSEFRHKPIWF